MIYNIEIYKNFEDKNDIVMVCLYFFYYLKYFQQEQNGNIFTCSCQNSTEQKNFSGAKRSVLTEHLYPMYFRSIKENGCLKVLKGSHKLGRINHVLSGELLQADLDHLNAAFEIFPLEYVEMMPGDVLFFHCNLLHSRYSGCNL